MTASVNGKDVLNCLISEPRVGAWSAEFDADSDEALVGGIVLQVDGHDFVGSVQRGDVESGRVHVRMIAGRGGLSTPLDAKFYVGVSMHTVLNDIMRLTREELSPETDAAVLGRIVPRWTRSKASAGQALRQIADDCGVIWRVLRDGTIWLGTDSWPDASVVYEEIKRTPSDSAITIAPEGPSVKPGSSFLSRRVSRVVTTVDAVKLRQDIVWEDATTGPAPPQSRMAKDVATVVESLVGNRIDYSRHYSAKVLKQATDGTLEIIADDPKVRGNGITRVPIRHGVPGVRVRVSAGARVMLFFENGDPKAPAAGLWPDGSSVREVTIEASTSITIEAPEVIINGNLSVDGTITADDCVVGDAIPVSLKDHKHTGVTPGGGLSGPPGV